MMRVYSPFFSTLHDETAPTGKLGRGTHYSVLRAVLWTGGVAKFHDFAVIWDEDHDLRMIWVIERMAVERLLGHVLVIGERKGTVTVLTECKPTADFESAVRRIAQSLPTDSFSATVEPIAEATNMLVNDSVERVRSYVRGIVALWAIGTKECEFTVEPFTVR